MKIVKKIPLKNVIFTAVKNRCILHGRVFIMKTSLWSTRSYPEASNFRFKVRLGAVTRSVACLLRKHLFRD